MKRMILAATVLACCEAAQAAPAEPDSAAKPEASAPKKKMKMKAQKPMKMDEPMKTPMARDGMMMGDVKEGAAKKDAAMKDMMTQEEAKMPASGK